MGTADFALWSDYSAYFNGDAVRVELLVDPKDQDVSARVDRLIVGERASAANGLASPESLCGADDRTASTNPRVGRLMPAITSWPIPNGAFLTAGHCADSDPDGSGPMLPDGNQDSSEARSSSSTCRPPPRTAPTRAAAPQDQFPVVANSARWCFDGEGQGLGKDWAYSA